jgi:malate dehydrogenase (oxaloacetate-decarboxylating)
MDIYEESLSAHRNLRGKLEIVSKVPLRTTHDLSVYYSPGVGAVSEYLANNHEETHLYTGTNNSVAVISDGTSVLGLGNIGPEGALPVMEGKAMLFKIFGGIDAFPIVLSTQDPDEIIETVVAIAPSFGGINLEDIAAPNCFYIEEDRKKRLKMPIMHDDQHGTAVVVLAGLINALKVVGKTMDSLSVVIIGAGAAGTAIAKLLHAANVHNIVVTDSVGPISSSRTDLTAFKQQLAGFNIENRTGDLAEVLVGADVVIGVSRAGLIKPAMVSSMNKDAIVFALANPEPEIFPDVAKKAGAAVVATGRSDLPNQVNNVLAFPGIFRGALDNRCEITEDHKLAAAVAIASLIRKPEADLIIPSALDSNVVKVVASIFKR